MTAIGVIIVHSVLIILAGTYRPIYDISKHVSEKRRVTMVLPRFILQKKFLYVLT